MEISQELYDNLWSLVATTNRQVLVMQFMGEMRAYVVESFSPKTRDVFFNEVRGAQEVTDLAVHLTFQASQTNPITLQDRIQGRSKKDFKFGHDNYIWLISNKENIY
jgi:hypothetical protein